MAGLIDVGILKPELAGSFAAGYRGAEEQRNALAQRQQQAAQAEQQLASGRQRLQMDEMTMQRMQEDRAALTGLRARLRAAGQSDDPKVFFRVLAESDDPNVMMKGIEGLQRYRALEAYDREFGSGGAGATAMPSSAPNAMVAPSAPATPSGELVAAPITPPTGVMRAIAPGGAMGAEMPLTRGAPTNTLAPPAAAPVNAMLAAQPTAPTAPNIDALRRQYGMAVAAGRSDAPVLLEQIKAALKPDPTPSELRTMQTLGYPMTQAGYASFRAAQMKDSAPPSMVAEYNFARSPDGGGFKGSYQDFVTARAAAGRAPVQPKSELSSKAPAGYRFTPTGDLEPIPGGPSSPGLSPKEIQKREAVFPQATSSVKSIETKSDQFITELEKLRDDPGLDQITGPIYGRTPSVSRAGSRAQALYDKIFAKGGFQALQDMREASKTGGALGNVSNEEGRRLEKSVVGGLDRTQNIADVKQGINDLIQEILVSKSRVREAYDSTYSYKSGGGAATPARSLTPQDQEALNWANSNPNDPRAAQIKQRLGAK
jgi:hypothetical protein